MKYSYLKVIQIVLVSIILFSCSTPSDSTPLIDYTESFTPLYIGLEKNYIGLEDSTLLFTEIVGKVIREDGQSLFINKNQFVNLKDESESNSKFFNTYHFISNGYLNETSIIKSDNGNNPFWERRIAKGSPIEGESWNLYCKENDEQNWEVTTEYIGEMSTPAGVFEDVYCFQIITEDIENSDTSKYYHVKEIGNIAIYSLDNKFEVSYIRTEDREYGEKLF